MLRVSHLLFAICFKLAQREKPICSFVSREVLKEGGRGGAGVAGKKQGVVEGRTSSG